MEGKGGFSSPFLEACMRDGGASALPQRTGSTENNRMNPDARRPAADEEDHKLAAENLNFISLCRVFDAIANSEGRKEQCAVLEKLWKSLSLSSSFYPVMRLLMPQLDSERPVYHLKESKLARLYMDIIGLSPDSTDGRRLLHWKDPSRSALETTNFSDVVYVMLQSKGGFQEQPHLPSHQTCKPRADELKTEGFARAGTAPATVADINDALDRLAAAENTEARQAVLLGLLRRTSPTEQRWLLRIILKDMKFRMSHQSMLSAFHPTALDKLNRASDLRYVCDSCLEEMKRPVPGSGAAGIFLFQPIRPMLASPVTSKRLEQLLESGGVYMEPKYDGERIMLHVDGDSIMYWTRNTKNFTSLYGPKFDHVVRACLPGCNAGIGVSSAGRGAEPQTFAVCQTPSSTTASDSSCPSTASDGSLFRVENVILDGEFLVYDGETNSFVEFGSNRTFANASDAAVTGGSVNVAAVDNQHRWFCYMVFDVVFLNGASLMELPYTTRRSVLQRIIGEKAKHFEIVRATRVRTTREILTGLERALDDRKEGIVLKKSSSHYTPAERKGHWVKLKTDHIVGLSDTMDFVVVGGFYGTKFGTRGITHFLLATWDKAAQPDPLDPRVRFLTVCKIGNGYTSEELRAIQMTLHEHWETMPNRQTVPVWLDAGKPTLTDLTPDVYVHPSHSVVFEVMGYSFTDSINYRVGYTIRFPRMLRVRWDKGLADITDLQTLGEIREASRDALRPGATGRSASAAGDELLTVLALKWRQRRERAQAAATAVAAAVASGVEGSDGQRRAQAQYGMLPPRSGAMAADPLCVAQLAEGERPVDDLFAGYEFCVLFTSLDTVAGAADAPAEMTTADVAIYGVRQELERLLLRHGARVVANPGRSTSLLLASTAAAPRVRNWCEMCRKHPTRVLMRYPHPDVVSVLWVSACVARGEVRPLAPRFMLYTSPQLRRKFEALLDRFEDSYYELTDDPDDLRRSLKLAETEVRRQRAGTQAGTTPDDADAGDWTELSRRVHAARAELELLPSRPADVCFRGVAAVRLVRQYPDGPTPSSMVVPPTASRDGDDAVYFGDLLSILAQQQEHEQSGSGSDAGAAGPQWQRPKLERTHQRRWLDGGGSEGGAVGDDHQECHDKSSLHAQATVLPLPGGLAAVDDVPQIEWSTAQLIAATQLVLEHSCYICNSHVTASLLIDQDGCLYWNAQ